jgi:hypothetical protein
LETLPQRYFEGGVSAADLLADMALPNKTRFGKLAFNFESSSIYYRFYDQSSHGGLGISGECDSGCMQREGASVRRPADGLRRFNIMHKHLLSDVSSLGLRGT